MKSMSICLLLEEIVGSVHSKITIYGMGSITITISIPKENHLLKIYLHSKRLILPKKNQRTNNRDAEHTFAQGSISSL